jgi:hypothetical protein
MLYRSPYRQAEIALSPSQIWLEVMPRVRRCSGLRAIMDFFGATPSMQKASKIRFDVLPRFDASPKFATHHDIDKPMMVDVYR